MNVIGQAAVIVALGAVGGVGSFYLHPHAPALYAVQEPVRDDEVTLEQVGQRWQGDVLWLDARPRSDFDQEHIPGARLLNEQEFDNLMLDNLELLQTNMKPVVVYCSGQRCDASRHVREKLREVISVSECYVLHGGWPAWKAAQSAK
jgi:rhodanese-related sulfurtransferase